MDKKLYFTLQVYEPKFNEYILKNRIKIETTITQIEIIIALMSFSAIVNK